VAVNRKEQNRTTDRHWRRRREGPGHDQEIDVIEFRLVLPCQGRASPSLTNSSPGSRAAESKPKEKRSLPLRPS
jgi:hypothetical protein